MTNNEQIAILEDVSANHAFFFGETIKAWAEMFELAFHPELNSGQFEAAQKRFDLARERCKKEMERLPAF